MQDTAQYAPDRCPAVPDALVLLTLSVPRLPAQERATAAVEDSVCSLELQRGQALLRADTAALSRMVADEFIEISRLGL